MLASALNMRLRCLELLVLSRMVLVVSILWLCCTCPTFQELIWRELFDLIATVPLNDRLATAALVPHIRMTKLQSEVTLFGLFTFNSAFTNFTVQ